MCMHVKRETFEGVVLKGLRLLRKVVVKSQISDMSNCLDCIKMARDNRYVINRYKLLTVLLMPMSDLQHAWVYLHRV